MSEDLIIKTLTGLMVEQRSMTGSQRRLAEEQKTLAEQQKALAEQMAAMAGAFARQAQVLTDQGDTMDELTEASARQEARFKELLDVMITFAATSADTRKRLAAVEADVAKLKDAS